MPHMPGKQRPTAHQYSVGEGVGKDGTLMELLEVQIIINYLGGNLTAFTCM